MIDRSLTVTAPSLQRERGSRRTGLRVRTLIAVATASLSLACAAERGIAVRKPTVLLVRIAANVQEASSRKIVATAFFTPPGVVARPVVLSRTEVPIEIGQTDLPLTIDITLCLGDISTGVEGKTCPLAIALALRDTANALIDSVVAGPVDVGANTTATFPPVMLRRVGTIVVSPGTARLAIGDAQPMAAALVAPTGDTLASRPVKWTSSAPAIATVSTTGMVQGVRPGTATITASREEQSGSATITVPFQAVAQWTANPPSTTLGSGPSPWTSATSWARSASEIYVAGGGLLARFDGTNFTRLNTAQGFCCIESISGTASDNIFMVGSVAVEVSGNFVISTKGVAYLYNGTTALAMALPSTDNLTGVYAAAPNVAFAVGLMGTIHRYDGTAWTRMAVPTTRHLRGVCGFSPSDVYAVGDSGTTLHYDGTRWTSSQVAVNSHLASVYCAAPNAIFAGGYNGLAVVLHTTNGQTWTSLPLPPRSWGIRSISGTSARDVYAVGWNATMVHYDGTTWSQTPSPWDEWSTNLITVAAAPGIAIAGGAEGLTLVNRGQGWQKFGALPYYRDVWASSASNIIAVGSHGTIDRYDGTRWTSMDSRTSRTYLSVWGAAPNDVWAAGADGLLQHYDGTTWTLAPSPTTMYLERMWGSDARNIFAVGCCGSMVRHNGATWTVIPSGTQSSLHSIWGTSATDIFAVGDNGTIVHFDGSQWTPMQSPTTESLLDVWGTGPRNVYAVGGNETILRYDGTAWRVEKTARSGSTYHAVWGSGPEDVYAIGCGTPAISARFDGTRWRGPLPVCAWKMTGFPAGGAVAVLWSRFAYFGLSPNGQLGASHATASSGFEGPPPRPVLPGNADRTLPNGWRP